MSEGRTVNVADRSWGWGKLPRPLVALGGARPPAPAWFDAALAVPWERLFVPVAGVDVELMCWGERGRPGLLLLHGSMAHASWWMAVAPLLAKEYRVCALSFSGMGHSGRRSRYSVKMMAQEAWAAAEAGGLFDGPVAPIVAAHSFGGKAAALMAGGPDGARLLGTMFVDSFIVPDPTMDETPPYRRRVYQSETDAIARFRLAPDQPAGELYIIDAVARAGVRQEENGEWTWRFDPNFFCNLDYESGWDQAVGSRCPLAFIRGELSNIVSTGEQMMQRQVMRGDTLFLEIPDAHHHIMIDQPLALAAAMRAVCAGWINQAEFKGR